ncbi:hypothetical protein [Lacinutrix cladophorae]
MMQNRFLLFYFILFSSIATIAQNKFTDSIITALQKEPLFFEKVFIHTNKIKYNQEDTIWFKAYVSSNENTPSLKTTLLYVSLFSETGALIETQNILINKGVGIGQFELFHSLKGGNYYLQAQTNFMKNFGEANVFVSKISISNAVEEKAETNEFLYDVQLFPEGGFLLENVENVVAVKVLTNGLGNDFSGKIVDSNNNEVAHFKNAYSGMAKSKFYYKELEKYQAIIATNDSVFRVDVPLAKKQGVAITVSDDKDFITLQLQTNTQTIQNANDDYFILFHQNNKLVNYADVVLVDTSKIKLRLNKKDFFNGVNTVTVFENNTPVLERKFFVYKSNTKKEVKIEKLLEVKDSIAFKMLIKDTSGVANISASVLSNTVELDENASIESAFLLTPYLKGYIEKPSYYFNTNNKNRFNHLDLLLLTQGWTQYSSTEYVHNLNPKYKYNFEMGFKLSGYVKPLGSNNLALISEDNKIIDKIFLNNKLDFTFKNLLIYKGDSVKLSFVKPDKALAKPENMVLDSVSNYKMKFQPKKKASNYSLSKQENYSHVDFYQSNTTTLDTVNVSGKVKSRAYFEKKKLVNKYKKITSDIGKYMPLEVSDYYKNEFLLRYLEREEGVKLVNWKGLEWYLEVGVKKEALLFIDGKRMESEDLAGLKLEMKDIESVMMQPYPKEGGAVAYQVFTKDNYKKGIIELYQNYVFEYGYNAVKKYYTPINDFNFQNEIQEIDWKPILETNANGEVVFKVKQYNSGYTFYVQGFTKAGALISEIMVVE